MNSDKNEFVTRRLSKAKKTLSEVNILVENELWNTAVNRLYYACFYAVTALLMQSGIDTKTHSGSRRMFNMHFVKSGKISDEYGELYSALFEMRQNADYEYLVEYERRMS